LKYKAYFILLYLQLYIVRGCGLGSSGSRCEPLTDSREYGNKLLSSLKGEKFLDQLSDY